MVKNIVTSRTRTTGLLYSEFEVGTAHEKNQNWKNHIELRKKLISLKTTLNISKNKTVPLPIILLFNLCPKIKLRIVNPKLRIVTCCHGKSYDFQHDTLKYPAAVKVVENCL